MHNHGKQTRRSSRRRRPQRPATSFVERAFAAFCQLSEPAQTIFVVGVLLLLAWLVAHPFLLADLLKGVLGVITAWVTLKQL